MRDRLVELINNNGSSVLTANDFEELADYLLENGVIVPPCKEGDTVYIIKRCSCNKPDCYHTQQCYKKITMQTPKFVDRVMMLETGRKCKYDYFGRGMSYEEYEKGTVCRTIYEKPFTLEMLTKIGKTVFLTKEEAQQSGCYVTDTIVGGKNNGKRV